MQYIRSIQKFFVLIGFLSVHLTSSAGSYEDFFKAVRLDDVKTVQALLERGFDPNTVSQSGSVVGQLAQDHH
jgi:uncharacterized protein